MKLTLQIQLLPDNEQSQRLKETLKAFNSACSWLAQKAFELKCANKIELQKQFYYDIRSQFHLSAQMAIRCIAQVVEAYKRDKSKCPKFRKYASMPYDERFMSFKGIDRVSLLTLQGRIVIPFIMGKYHSDRFSYDIGQCDLCLRKDGLWFLLATVDVPESTPIPHTDFIGIDFGIVNIATTSSGETFSGKDVEVVRQKYHHLRQTLQHKASKQSKCGKRPRNIRRFQKQICKYERNFRKHQNHAISKQLVEKAKDTLCGIALEDLQGIRDRTRFKREQRAKMAGWSFYQLRQMIEYKAKLQGVPILFVDPRNTSRECFVCGHTDKANRKTQAEFVCIQCNHSDNADLNAAKNIRRRASVSMPKESENIDCQKSMQLQVQSPRL